ncbi:uncharacterized protein CLUP02_15785 [Colletotrichum lupini]|uniref:Uncharacterized protein n=1 Tax=Colletotrichum lupini TaxID=145971 RepID=A0A9Q8T778_9PEZI|nr:uncharacterized protein CLUP02_15785 [Colletotrichum lupini]KAK1714479.1 hypothetical protein BDP67DRAFT_514175 [Colletotrichum lupini]UQC90255.1 hypothetical protein CLUP02_15785 [Colletotrichum lupini]
MTNFLLKLKKGARQLLPSYLSTTTAEKVEENMEKEIFEGRYTDESVVAQHLRAIFPGQRFQISSERGRIFCNIPRKLTPAEQEVIAKAIRADRYAPVR